MKKTVYTLAFLLLASTWVDAATYKGQKEFSKECSSCHSGGQSFVGTKTLMDWEDLMFNDARMLVNIHKKSQEAKESLEYFQSKRFLKRMKHLKDFLFEYAKDSGQVAACG